MKSSLLLLALLLSSSPLSAQVIRPAGQHQANKAESQFDKGITPPVRQRQSADPAKLREDASELATLAQSIPPAMDQPPKGSRPKDQGQFLIRLSFRAKQLRSRI